MDPATLSLILSVVQIAGGIGLQLFQNKGQRELTKMGYELNNASIAASMALIKAESEQIAATNMQSLRQAIGAQAAITGARNQLPSGQDAARVFKSESRFAKDEKIRHLNLLTKMTNLKAAGLKSHVEMMTSEAGRANKFFGGLIDSMPITSIVDYATNRPQTTTTSVQSSAMRAI